MLMLVVVVVVAVVAVVAVHSKQASGPAMLPFQLCLRLEVAWAPTLALLRTASVLI